MFKTPELTTVILSVVFILTAALLLLIGILWYFNRHFKKEREKEKKYKESLKKAGINVDPKDFKASENGHSYDH